MKNQSFESSKSSNGNVINLTESYPLKKTHIAIILKQIQETAATNFQVLKNSPS